MKKLVILGSAICSMLFALDEGYPQHSEISPYSQMPQNSYNPNEFQDHRMSSELSPAKLAYTKNKNGWFIGFDIPLSQNSTTMQTSIYVLSVNGTMSGFGIKAGYQTFQTKIPSIYLWGSRIYASYRYLGAKLDKENLSKSDASLYKQSFLLHADSVIDIPFNFKRPSSGLSISYGVLFGGYSSYDGISKLDFSPAIGVQAGFGVNIAAKHRIEYIAQFILPFGDLGIGNYGKQYAGSSGYKIHSNFSNYCQHSIGYSYVF